MTINGIKVRLKQIGYVYCVFRSVSKYLKKGSYSLQENMRSLVNKKDVALYSKYIREEPKTGALQLMVKLINHLNIFLKIHKCNITDSNYGAVYIANNNDINREVKLFDEQNGKVMVFFTDIQSKKSYIEQFELLHNTFRIPNIYAERNNESNRLVISLIRKDPNVIPLEAIKCICKAHMQQLRNTPSERFESIQQFISKNKYPNISNESYLLIEQLKKHISDEVFDNEYIVSLQHGDLSADNLIYGASNNVVDYWWIDWEHAGLRVFFYDVFFYILNTAVADGNLIPMKEFVSGVYDNCLEELFSVAGYKYNKQNRSDYFLLFSLFFIVERLGRDDLKAAIHIYRQCFIEYFDVKV